MTNSEVYNTVFVKNEHINICPIYSPGFWQFGDTNKKREALIEQRKTSQIKLNVEVDRRGLGTKIRVKIHKL